MKSKLLKQAFDPFYEIPLSAWEPLADASDVLAIKKETILKAADRIEKHVHLVLEGSICILLPSHASFICTDMLFENEFACEYLSFLTRKPTPYEVRTMEDARVLRFSYQAMERFTSTSKYGDKLWRYATQALYVDKLQQQLELLALTPSQRYARALELQGSLVQRIPQKYMASYLGVTQQSLSRMRRNLTKKGRG